MSEFLQLHPLPNDLHQNKHKKENHNKGLSVFSKVKMGFSQKSKAPKGALKVNGHAPHPTVFPMFSDFLCSLPQQGRPP